MGKGFVVASFVVHDEEGLAAHSEAATPTVGLHGGRFIASGMPETLQGDWPREHQITVIEFPSEDAAHAWFGSPEYQPHIAGLEAIAHDVSITLIGEPPNTGAQ